MHAHISMAVAIALSSAAGSTLAQTNPWEIPKPDTYRGSMELQRREQQQSQQNNQSPNAPAYAPAPNNNIGANQAAAKAAYAKWDQTPALPADKNPLLGRWTWQPAAARSDMNSMFNGSFANSLGCSVMFGDGLVEFRPQTIVNIQNGRESPVANVAYRGGGKQVIALQRDGMKAFLQFAFVTPDRISLAGVPCVMTRAGVAAAPAAAAAKTR